jgi:dihydrodipicolinate synthase/N-acetylneuraminate lyase
LQIAYLHDERREPNEALAILKQIEATYPEEPQMLVQMAKTYQAQGDFDNASRYRRRFEEVQHQLEKRSAEARAKKAAMKKEGTGGESREPRAHEPGAKIERNRERGDRDRRDNEKY